MKSRNFGYGDIKLFTCNANTQLAQGIAKNLSLSLGDAVVGRFSDGEISMRIDETVRGLDTYIIQPTSPPVNDNLMELLIMVDALRRASAARITAVIPYFGYARQDRKARSHDPISAKLVADLIAAAGVDRVLSMDLHCPQLQGFFNVPVDHLRGVYMFINYYREHLMHKDDFVVVSPDLGSVGRVRAFAESINLPLAIVDKRRPSANVAEVMNVIGGGDIKGKNVIFLDDMLDTGGSLLHAVAAIKDLGANSIYACVTHPILSGDAKERVEASDLEQLIVLDTIHVSPERRPANMKILSVAEYFANAIRCIHDGTALSSLFES